MKNRAILNITMLTLGILGINSVTAFATSNDSWSSLDYVEQKTIIEQNISDISLEVTELKEKTNVLKEYLAENETEIVDTQKEYQAKKDVTKYNVGSNNDLMMLEMVLNSDSIGEFLQNLDIAKGIYVQKNKTLHSLNYKEEQLLELREKTNEEYSKLEELLIAKEDELSKSEEAKVELEELIKRKAEDVGFNPDDLLQKSNVSLDDMYKALEGTGLYELAPVYVEAENLYGVNALFIAGICAQESGWGTSDRAIRDNNLTGFGVYGDSAVGINAPTKRDNILMTTKWIKNKYLTPGASYYKGYGIRDVNVSYCIGYNGSTDFNWSEHISEIANKLLNKINN